MTKEEFDKIYVGEKTAVNCDTEEKDDEFLALADSFGYQWIHGRSYLKENFWNIYKKDTTYYIQEGKYGNIDYSRKEGHTIVKYPMCFNKTDLQSGDMVIIRIIGRGWYLKTTNCLYDECVRCVVSMDEYSDTFEKVNHPNPYFDIMEVWRDNKLIWKREEKSERDKQIENIQSELLKLSDKQKELSDEIEKLK